MFALAHLSDLHLRGDAGATERVRVVRDHLGGLLHQVDAVLVTGDVTDAGDPADYAAAVELFAGLGERLPVLFCPGNHDERTAFRRGLLGADGEGDGDAAGPVDQAYEIAGVDLLLLDSSVPGDPSGELADATLEWLERQLSASDRPALLALHHPPAPLGMPALDAIRLRSPERLEAIVRAHDRVAAVLCGHAHTAAATTFAGRPLRAAPGVTSTVLLPWEVGDRYATSTELPPALAFHLLDGGVLTTHYRALPLPPARG